MSPARSGASVHTFARWVARGVARRATRIGEMIEQVLEGKLRLPEVMAKRTGRTRVRAFTVEPEVIINNQWSDRYTVIEVSGLDRPGLLYQLTTAISKLNLNIASAMWRHSASGPATCSMSPTCSAHRSPRRPGRPRSSARWCISWPTATAPRNRRRRPS